MALNPSTPLAALLWLVFIVGAWNAFLSMLERFDDYQFRRRDRNGQR